MDHFEKYCNATSPVERKLFLSNLENTDMRALPFTLFVCCIMVFSNVAFSAPQAKNDVQSSADIQEHGISVPKTKDRVHEKKKKDKTVSSRTTETTEDVVPGDITRDNNGKFVKKNEFQAAPSKKEGVSARCKDGTFSHSKQHSGACSRHGGVAEWLN
ncbi:DUF3761 domain-containing protein [Enterobacter hormaechei]|uniref:DUF3761 domain-containing protein n=1 Tax=Enterobacter hormaechei TaxID=158836 RepID=UPI0032DB1CB5